MNRNISDGDVLESNKIKESNSWSLFNDSPLQNSNEKENDDKIRNVNYGEHISHRPFVHIFCIQDNMDQDCLELVSFYLMNYLIKLF